MFLWFWLLTKRLYKKTTFLVILLLIPVLVFSYRLAARGDSGIVTVALAWETETPAALEIADRLETNNQLIRFLRSESPEEARRQVAAGKADAAWIFLGDTGERILAFAADPADAKPLVQVVQREDNVFLMLSRESLGSATYFATSEAVYLNFIRSSIPELSDLSDEVLLDAYNRVNIHDDLFIYGSREKAAEESGYLLSPVRGLLAVIIVLCGLATSLYYFHDRQKGTFSWVPLQRQPLVEFGCQIVSVLNITLVALFSLGISGLAGSLPLELALLGLYGLDVSLFCMLVRRCLGNLKVMATLLPLLVVIILAVCPVFFDLPFLHIVQLLFPPTYFIHALYAPSYFLFMALHSAACALLYLLAGKFKA